MTDGSEDEVDRVALRSERLCGNACWKNISPVKGNLKLQMQASDEALQSLQSQIHQCPKTDSRSLTYPFFTDGDGERHLSY